MPVFNETAEPIHRCSVYKNQELLWLPNDTEDVFIKNMAIRRLEMTALGWDKAIIKYNFNSHGFRTGEFNIRTHEKTMMFLGCSIPFGIGLPLECTMPVIVSEILGVQCYNLTLPGSSNDTAFRIAQYWIPKLKPDTVVLVSPEMTRLEVMKYKQSIPFRVNDKASMKSEFYLNWILDEQNGKLNREKNKLAIENICLSKQSDFYYFPVEENFEFIDKARDLSHQGIQSHLLATERLLRLISENNQK